MRAELPPPNIGIPQSRGNAESIFKANCSIWSSSSGSEDTKRQAMSNINSVLDESLLLNYRHPMILTPDGDLMSHANLEELVPKILDQIQTYTRAVDQRSRISPLEFFKPRRNQIGY